MSISRISFKDFLLNENKYYLGQRVGDILTAVQDLQQNSEGMGARQLVANASRIVNQVRSILHSNWAKSEDKYLKDLQKVGVALAKAIDEKDDLEEIIPTISTALERISSKMGVPVQSLGTPSDEKESGTEDNQTDDLAPTQGKKEPEPSQQQQQQPPPQSGQEQQPPQQPAPQPQQPPQQPPQM